MIREMSTEVAAAIGVMSAATVGAAAAAADGIAMGRGSTPMRA